MFATGSYRFQIFRTGRRTIRLFKSRVLDAATIVQPSPGMGDARNSCVHTAQFFRFFGPGAGRPSARSAPLDHIRDEQARIGATPHRHMIQWRTCGRRKLRSSHEVYGKGLTLSGGTSSHTVVPASLPAKWLSCRWGDFHDIDCFSSPRASGKARVAQARERGGYHGLGDSNREWH